MHIIDKSPRLCYNVSITKMRQKGGNGMQISYYIPILMLLFIVFLLQRRRKAVIAQKAIKRRKTEDKTKMLELAKRFIGKECLVYAFDGGHQFDGVIKEVTDGAILLEKDGKEEAINLDFVIRIREYPRNKNGKKKSVVLD